MPFCNNNGDGSRGVCSWSKKQLAKVIGQIHDLRLDDLPGKLAEYQLGEKASKFRNVQELAHEAVDIFFRCPVSEQARMNTSFLNQFFSKQEELGRNLADSFKDLRRHGGEQHWETLESFVLLRHIDYDFNDFGKEKQAWDSLQLENEEMWEGMDEQTAYSVCFVLRSLIARTCDVMKDICNDISSKQTEVFPQYASFLETHKNDLQFMSRFVPSRESWRTEFHDKCKTRLLGWKNEELDSFLNVLPWELFGQCVVSWLSFIYSRVIYTEKGTVDMHIGQIFTQMSDTLTNAQNRRQWLVDEKSYRRCLLICWMHQSLPHSEAGWTYEAFNIEQARDYARKAPIDLPLYLRMQHFDHCVSSAYSPSENRAWAKQAQLRLEICVSDGRWLVICELPADSPFEITVDLP